ncbi:MAG: lysophospholipase [Acidimicrobiales bacterium]
MTEQLEPETFFAANVDGGTQLRRHWAPVGDRRAAVVLVHGIAEHSGRYLHVGAALAQAGFDVLTFDNRGFGQSDGKRGHIDSFDRFSADVGAAVAEQRRHDVPVVLIGHSLGGLISTGHLVRGAELPDIAVLSAPAIAAEIPRWQRVVAPVLARVAPSLFVPSKTDGTLLSRDVTVQQDFVDDPLRVGGATAAFGMAAFDEMELASTGIASISVPLYVLHGAEDELVPTASSEAYTVLPDATRRVWDGLRHECFNEPEGPEVIAEMIAWIDSRL